MTDMSDPPRHRWARSPNQDSVFIGTLVFHAMTVEGQVLCLEAFEKIHGDKLDRKRRLCIQESIEKIRDTLADFELFDDPLKTCAKELKKHKWLSYGLHPHPHGIFVKVGVDHDQFSCVVPIKEFKEPDEGTVLAASLLHRTIDRKSELYCTFEGAIACLKKARNKVDGLIGFSKFERTVGLHCVPILMHIINGSDDLYHGYFIH